MRHPDRFTCEEVLQRLDDFLDRELAPEEMRLVREHLDTCVQCAREHRFESRVIDSVRSKLQRLQAPDTLLRRVGKLLSDRPDGP